MIKHTPTNAAPIKPPQIMPLVPQYKYPATIAQSNSSMIDKAVLRFNYDTSMHMLSIRMCRRSIGIFIAQILRDKVDIELVLESRYCIGEYL